VKAVNTFGRFDKFKAKYNPLGRTEMRSIFLKRDNDIKGRYFAELMQEVLQNRTRTNTKLEYRISVYGR
jgi:AMP deaminase